MNTERLAIEGGKPVRTDPLPYGRQSITDEDVAAVADALRSDWLTTGPRVASFEKSFARVTGAPHAIAVSSGTAALHVALHAAGVRAGDEVVVPPMTFAASANAALYLGARPVFADVDVDTLCVDPGAVRDAVTPRTRAIIGVDYAGQPCDWDFLRDVASGIPTVDDAAHSLGGSYRGRPVGSLADISTFSFHPVKTITTGEGGMVTTADDRAAERSRVFRNHGITTDHRQRSQSGAFFYEMVELGNNYRLSDIHAALGRSQLARLPAFVATRRAIAAAYDEAFQKLETVRPVRVRADVVHAYHIYPLRLELDRLKADRQNVFQAIRAEGIGVNVHYVPVHLHPYYRRELRTGPGLCPRAEAAYEALVTLPVFARMTPRDVDDVIAAVTKVLRHYAR